MLLVIKVNIIFIHNKIRKEKPDLRALESKLKKKVLVSRQQETYIKMLQKSNAQTNTRKEHGIWNRSHTYITQWLDYKDK